MMASVHCFLLFLVVAAVGARKTCREERQEALDRQENNPEMVGIHVPKCDANGDYQPKECKQAYCSCLDYDGYPIRGYLFHISKSARAECRCARQKDYVRSQHLLGQIISCDKVGNYKGIQCLGSKCYCVEPKYGMIQVAARKPCHEERQDALDRQQNNIGMVGIHVPKCDQDGTYSPKQCIEAYCHCVDKDGNVIVKYFFSVSKSAETECKCAREKDYLHQHGMIGRTIACDKAGNYERSQCTGSKCYCVDSKTGEKIGDVVPISQKDSLNC
uniref:Thyroglobulin type-1 domain-containing protein n=1 Tax=Strigamia maritima TaxID=126957 RepID=T1IZE8_STRMM